jgi:hypothetical protein
MSIDVPTMDGDIKRAVDVPGSHPSAIGNTSRRKPRHYSGAWTHSLASQEKRYVIPSLSAVVPAKAGT